MYPQVGVEREALPAVVAGEGAVGGVNGGYVVFQLCPERKLRDKIRLFLYAEVQLQEQHLTKRIMQLNKTLA